MDVLKFPNPHLFKSTKEVTVFGEELLVLLNSMYETMKANNGLGLAANQVGLSFKMFVMDGPEGRLNLINPIIVAKSVVAANMKEGCLSAPGDFFVVPSRAQWVTVEFQDETGFKQKRTFKGLLSVCAQHEIEHLEGESFMQNKSLPKEKKQQLAKKWGV